VDTGLQLEQMENRGIGIRDISRHKVVAGRGGTQRHTKRDTKYR
jgi:hypothetical protein